MRGAQDVAGFIRAFAGDHRYIVDYLVEEVLQRQPESVRSFLLQTAILDRLSGPLCDAVTGQERRHRAVWRPWSAATSSSCRWMTSATGIAITTSLPTCSPRTCWRSSPIRSRRCIGARARGTSSMVSAADAIRHALAAEDFARAADLVELAVPAMHRSRQEATLLGWLRALPDELVRRRPVLSARVCLGVTAQRRARGRGGPAAGRRTVAGHDGRRGVRDRTPRRPRWSSWTKRNFAGSRVRSPCTAPGRPWLWAMWPAPWHTPGGRSTSSPRTTISGAERPRRSWGSPPGRAGTSRRRTGRMPRAWRVCSGPGTSPTHSAAPSPWPISGSRKVVSTRRCAPTSRRCSWRRSRARRSCGARPTCTWA